MLAACGRDAGVVAVASNIVRIGRSRTLEERNHWMDGAGRGRVAASRQNRSDVVPPIDDDALYEGSQGLTRNRTMVSTQ